MAMGLESIGAVMMWAGKVCASEHWSAGKMAAFRPSGQWLVEWKSLKIP
jgi:hypothetical protein